MNQENSLAVKFPDIAKEWSDKNIGLTPQDVSYGSNKIVWWIGNCGHEWEAAVKARTTKEEGCPYCAGKRVLVGFNDLGTLHPELAEEWSEKNTDLNIQDITAGSQKKVWWKGKCGHEWQASIKNRANGSACPYCTSKAVKPGVNDLKSTRPDIAAEWSDKNYPIQASDVMPNTNKKYWWKCKEGHEWKALVSSRTRGTKCPYCSGLILLPGYNDLATTHPLLAEEWSSKNVILPDSVNAKSRESVTWQCRECGYEWSTAIYKRARSGRCPECERQQRIRESLIRERIERAKEQFEFCYPWILLKHLLKENGVEYLENDTDQIGARIQIFLPEYKVAVEIMGNRIMEGFALRRELVKNRLCQANGLKMVRILDPGGESMDGCVCIRRDDMDSASLDEAYGVLFSILGIKVAVDSRILSPILFKSYLEEERNF